MARKILARGFNTADTIKVISYKAAACSPLKWTSSSAVTLVFHQNSNCHYGLWRVLPRSYTVEAHNLQAVLRSLLNGIIWLIAAHLHTVNLPHNSIIQVEHYTFLWPWQKEALLRFGGQTQSSRIGLSEKLQPHQEGIQLLHNISNSHNKLDQMRDSMFHNRV